MDRAAVWQHSSNSNIKTVHNSIEHFLWNSSDFSSDDVLSCLWIVFTNFVFQVLPPRPPPPPPENSQAVQDVGNRMVRGYWFKVKWFCPMESYAWGIQVFCSVLISQTEHLNTLGLTSDGTDTFRVKLITPSHPIPNISTHLTVFWGGTWKTEFVKTIHRQLRTSSEKKWDEFHKKCSIGLWTISLFDLLLCCHTAVRCMEQT